MRIIRCFIYRKKEQLVPFFLEEIEVANSLHLLILIKWFVFILFIFLEIYFGNCPLIDFTLYFENNILMYKNKKNLNYINSFGD